MSPGAIKFQAVLLIGIIIGLLSTSGDAYVLQGPHLLELVTAQSGKVERLLVAQKLLIYNDNSTDGPIELNETVRYLFPESFRSEVESAHAKRIHILSKDSAVTIIDGKISAEEETDFDRYKDIILYHSRVSLNERLTCLGVDVTITSLGRFQDEIAYVMGAQYPDESNSQIWIDRKTFRPFRWLMINDNQPGRNETLEVLYLNWQQIRGFWYPMRIEFREGERLVREIQVGRIMVDPAFPESLFDVQRAKSLYQPAERVAPEKEQQGAISEIEKTIEEFKKMYE